MIMGVGSPGFQARYLYKTYQGVLSLEGRKCSIGNPKKVHFEKTLDGLQMLFFIRS